jgi:DNA-binding GntR family transcriptional regulator
MREPLIAPRPKLGEECARHLRDLLMSGTYRAGGRLVVEELAQQLGVSAMPVREALIALANEGLVEVLPRRGFRVARIERRDVDDVFRVHSFVAGLLVEAAAAEISDDDVERLRGTQRDIERAAADGAAPDRAARIEQLNFRFHRAVNHVPDAGRLRWFLRAATRYVPRHFYESIPGWIDATVQDHPPIIEALADRDAARARRLMEAHVRSAGRMVVAHLGGTDLWSEA